MKKHYRHETDCLNCGAVLQGKFCHVCGQENLEVKESFGHMLNHAVSDYFHFDHQFFHTLKPLLLQPGKLTKEYLAGRRVQYLHPVKMYIFISLVYFLLIFKTNHQVVSVNNQGKHLSKQEVADKIKKELQKNPHLTDAQKKAIEKTATSYVSGSVKATSKNFSPIVLDEDDSDKASVKDSTFALYIADQNKLPANKRDDFGSRFLKKVRFTYTEKYGKNAMEMFGEDVKHNTPKLMFVLVPLFALILMIAFRNNKKYYVEHLIYAIHVHCYFFLFSAIILLIQLILPDSWNIVSSLLDTLLFFYTAWYIYRSLRNIYQRSRWRTVSKMIGVFISYWIFICVGLVGLVLVVAASA